ncbi:MAG: thioesterase family protein [Planctomycetota bacterium]
MAAPFRTTRFVEFADTDMAGIAHFSAFFRWMEAAEHALLRSLGLSVYGLADPDGGDAVVSFPRVSSRCDFHSPARCEDTLDVEVVVQKLGRSSVAYGFRFARDGEELAVGEMTSVCCRLLDGRKPEPIAIPDDVVASLKKHAP